MSSDSEVVLYYFPISFYSQKARLYLLEKGVSFTDRVVNLLHRENLSEWYMKLNPAGKVPLLKHGAQLIPDSHDIYLYGEKNLPGSCLIPPSRREEVLAMHDEIHAVNVGTLTYGCLYSEKYAHQVRLTPAQKEALKANMSPAQLESALNEKLIAASPEMMPTYMKKKDELFKSAEVFHDEKALESEMEKLRRLLPRLEQQLEKTYREYSSQSPSFLFSLEPTIADIDLILLVFRLRLLGLEAMFSKDRYPHLMRFQQQFESRPSFQKAVVQVYSSQQHNLFTSTMKCLPRAEMSPTARIVTVAGVVVLVALGAGALLAYLRRRSI